MLLVIVAFFFGVTTGKTIQSIDTPVKQEVKVRKVTVIPSVNLTRFTITPCNFTFIVPSTLSVVVSSESASLTRGEQNLELSCTKLKKNIVASGSGMLLNSIKSGFDTTFSIQSAVN